MSVVIASVLLPFLPETPIQLLVEGLLYDFGQMTLPFDHVDKEMLEKPKKLSIDSLKHFIFFMGPLSSAFDLIVFAFLLLVFKVKDAATFQTIWFSYSITSNLVGMHIIRTAKLPFVQSNAHKAVYISSILLIIARNCYTIYRFRYSNWFGSNFTYIYWNYICSYIPLLHWSSVCKKSLYKKIWRVDLIPSPIIII